MIDYCLRLADEAAFDALLAAMFGEDAPGCAIDRIGTILPSAGGPALPGWHVNLRFMDQPDAARQALLAPFVVYPATPSRVWA